MQLTEEQRLKKVHISLMKHPETALYSGVMMMGTSEIIDSAKVTAYTDGVNKKYGRTFIKALCATDPELAGLVLHENLHIALRHLLHNRDLFMEDRSTANMAADYVVNAIIMGLKDKTIVKLPEGGLYDPKYENMSMREVYRILRQEKQEREKDRGDDEGDSGSGEGEGLGNGDGGADGEYLFDEHDYESNAATDHAQAQEMDNRIDRALREGALLAGRLGLDIPRSISQLLDVKVDWRQELADFITSYTRGKDEYTWRKFNRRQIANDLYFPSVEDEAVGEVVVAIDTSGSIGQEQIDVFAGELISLCSAVSPETLRVLWWDTMVHGEQKFDGDYDNIPQLLKPQGGGGTRVGCVSEYITKNNISPECVIVFTDGFVEDKVNWRVTAPTLWLVTHNKSWTPPAGRKVMFES